MNWWIIIFAGEIQVILIIFSFIWHYFDFVIKFCFLKRTYFFDVINICCCCLILPFVFARFLNIGISDQSNALIFTPLSYLLWRLSFLSYTSFFSFLKNSWFFCVFWICSSFGRQLCQNCGWAGSELYVRSHITEPPYSSIYSEIEIKTKNRMKSNIGSYRKSFLTSYFFTVKLTTMFPRFQVAVFIWFLNLVNGNRLLLAVRLPIQL